MSTEYQIQLPVFEGPLDLLLHLIEREELDITTIALAQVTDQYMAYLRGLEQQKAKELTAFLVVAAKLLLIKSLALLPRPPSTPSEAEDVGDDLVRQLQAYKRFKEIASLLHEREKNGLSSYVRITPAPRLEPQLDLGDVTVGDLLVAVQHALDAIPAPPAGEVVSAITVTIDEQINSIQERLARRSRIRFRSILSQASTRVEVIVTLMAVLELIKRERIQVRQERMFGEIIIERYTPTEVQESMAPADVPAGTPADTAANAPTTDQAP
jgi:segregation and condensation protein A